jgi:hypothetical protein
MQRLAHLERAPRRWRMLGCAAIALLGLVVWLIGFEPPMANRHW